MVQWKKMKNGLAIVLAVTMACQPAGVYAEDFSSEAEVESYAEDFSAEEETENPTEEADASLEFEDGEESGDQDNSVENEAEVEFDASEPELSEEVTVEEEEDGDAVVENDLTSEESVDAAGSGEVLSGKCGDNLTWTLEDEVLTISGTGDMYTYEGIWTYTAGVKYHEAPWRHEYFTSLVIGKGITSISNNAFFGCCCLKTVEMPDVKNIGDNAFFKCGMKTIDLSNVETIGSGAFEGCFDLETVDLPNVEVLRSTVFRACDSLQTVNLPKVKEIWDYAFGSCKNLKTVKIPQVETILKGTFSGCSALEAVELPLVKEIGEYIFANCENLKTVKIPQVETIGKSAFESCSFDTIDIPRVKEIGEYAFYGCRKLKAIEFPEVELIGESAFSWCENLEEIKIPKAKTIGKEAFYICKSLKAIDFPEIEAIGEEAFCYCENLKMVKIPQVETIGKNAFKRCSTLEKVELSNAKTIGEGAFFGCVSLKAIELPEVETIEKNAFGECSVLENVDLPKAKIIGESAFVGCESLKAIELPETESIGQQAFDSLKTLKTADLPKVKTIGYNAFANSGLYSLNMPQVETIGAGAFESCLLSTDFSLPEGLKTIGGGAFAYSLQSDMLVIPSTVTDIGSYAFYSRISIVFFRGNPPTNVGSNIFYVDDTHRTLFYYPLNGNWTESDFESQSYGRYPSYNTWKGYDRVVLGKYVYNHDETCISDGSETAECICGCGGTDTRTVYGTKNPEKHTYSEKNCKVLSDGRKIYYCELCGKVKGDVTEKGTCGENLSWEIYDSDVLYITGTGPMYDYDVDNPAPWSGRSIRYCRLEKDVTTIGASAFEGCTSLETVDWGEKITSINGYAFYGCTSLKEMKLPKSITSIGENAFDGCASLQKVTAYQNLASIKNTSFRNCGVLTLCGYTGSYISEYAAEKKIPFESLGEWGKCGNYAEWYLNDGVLTITGSSEMNNYNEQKKAPWSGKKVTKCVIEDGITTIGSYAFADLGELTEISFPNSIFQAGEYAFKNCTGLKNIELPEKMEMWKISTGMFEGCISLETVKLSGNILNIGKGAFANCTSLRSFTVPEMVTEIEAGTFQNCESLASVTLSERVERVGKDAFSGCVLTEIQLPSKVTNIKENAFSGNKFTEITLPAALTELGANAFAGCEQLQAISVGEGSASFSASNGVLYDKAGTKLLLCPAGKEGSFTIPRRIKEIAESAFKDCSRITELILPSALTTIGKTAFAGMNLERIEISSEVTEIAADAFMNCYKLSEIAVDKDNAFYASVNGIFCDKKQEKVLICPPGLEMITLNEGIKSIEAGAFTGGEKEVVIDLPFSIKTIDASNDFRGKAVFKAYENARIVPLLKRRGYKWESKGTYALAWEDDGANHHMAIAYDNLVSVVSRYSNQTMKKGNSTFVYDGTAINYSYLYSTGNASITLKFCITESGIEYNRFKVYMQTRFGSGWGFSGTLYTDPAQIPGDTTLSYKWKIENERYCTTSQADAEKLANGALYNGIHDLWVSLSGTDLQMKDLGFIAYFKSDTVHTLEKSEEVAATCTKDGQKAKEWCSLCGAVKTGGEIIPATGHKEEVIQAVNPTCEKTGLTEGVKCSVCGEILKEQKAVPATGHSYGEWTVTENATCVKEGKETKTCTKCGDVQTRSMAKTAHTEVSIPGTEPTCTQPGLTDGSKCSVCGKILKEQEVTKPATGHVYGEWTVVEEATCTKNGTKTATCTKCGDVKKENIPAIGHKEEVIPEVAPTCGKAGLTEGLKCSVCGEILKKQTEKPATGKHKYSAYKITKAATALRTGSKMRICSVCNKKETASIKKLPATIKLNTTSIVLKVKQSTTKVKVRGLAKGDAVASWKSGNTKLVKVTNSGKITAGKKAGTTNVTITLRSGKKAVVKVKVQKRAVRTTRIMGVPAKAKLKAGKRLVLRPELLPITSVQPVTYTTSNKKVATVAKNGVIIAKKAGKVKITVKSGVKKFVLTLTVKK